MLESCKPGNDKPGNEVALAVASSLLWRQQHSLCHLQLQNPVKRTDNVCGGIFLSHCVDVVAVVS